MRKIIIGDIHGCYYTMLSLLNKINFNKNNDKIIFLGDYIDRGYYSYEVLKYLQNLERKMGKENCVVLMGNHEYMMLYDNNLWNLNGGAKTQESFNNNFVSIDCFNDWIMNLKFKYEDDEILCSHAGFKKEKIEDCNEYDLIWSRDYLFGKKMKREKQVFFGHTPMDDIYKTISGDICLDTGCVFDGKLSAAIIEEDGKTKFVSVKKHYMDKS